jgi:hypothetical protein
MSLPFDDQISYRVTAAASKTPSTRGCESSYENQQKRRTQPEHLRNTVRDDLAACNIVVCTAHKP